MKLSNPEKLILLMLSEIYEKLEINGDTNAKLIQSAIYSDNTWALSWEMPGVVGDSPREPEPECVSQVSKILWMWSLIEDSYANFSVSERKSIEENAPPFGAHVKFTGFDGNHEAEYLNITRFMIEDLKRYSSLGLRDFNSHVPMVQTYQKMLARFDDMSDAYDHNGLSVDQVTELMKARSGK